MEDQIKNFKTGKLNRINPFKWLYQTRKPNKPTQKVSNKK
jgi:hypothetical protein